MILAPILVSAAGWIGAININHANAPAIVALHGRPDAMGFDHGVFALGYGCTRRRADDAWPVGPGGPSCRTVFWTDAATGLAGDFFTSSRVYAEKHGVRVGMPTVTAERILHAHAAGGCSDAIHRGDLTIWFRGDTLWQLPSDALRVIGGHVDSFFVFGRNELGIFDC